MPANTAAGEERSWYQYVTIDLIVHILNRSIFHPYIAWLIPLCLRAVATQYDAPEFIAACIWATSVTLQRVLGVVNKRIAYGVPREVDWDEEVVVITGGANGLGKILAEMYGMRGASVAVLDIRKPEKESEGLAGVRFYACDVGDAAAVEKAKNEIEKDVCSTQYQWRQQCLASQLTLGTPTILINNAGIVNGKPLLKLSTADIQRNFNINLLSHFNTIRTFLPGMLASEVGGTLVTVASVLGKLGASHISDYTAAKAGLIAMHNSLRAEFASATAPEGAENIRTILVTPGQLNTNLFAGVQTPSSFFGPVVEPVELAREIVRMIDAGESGEISMPFYAKWIEWLHVLPVGLQKMVRRLTGMDRAMEGFGLPGAASSSSSGLTTNKPSEEKTA
ncbi:hypothetical protein LTR37_008235 [Vermiconidia calcicola]|uniref:Uncharacterized protein n=1 Tax=Vermiconidia calcicola TaxID=1690605 RepID=A0ACC3NB48_9PEZI|nr:hypothetical protein LTR37_008235 [Vermiconidia calcicola]